MTLAYSRTITFSQPILDIKNLPGVNQVVGSFFTSGTGTSFSTWRLDTGTQVGSSYASFSTSYSFMAMDFAGSTTLVACLSGPSGGTTHTDVWTINTSSGAKVDIGTLYTSAVQISQVVGLTSSGVAIAIPSTSRTGELGQIQTSSSTVTLVKPNWLNGYNVLCGCALDTGNGFIICCAFPNNTDITLFTLDSSFNLTGETTFSSSNITPASVSCIRYTNGYVLIGTTKCIALVDFLTGTIMEELMLSGGSGLISHMIGTEFLTAADPIVIELDPYITPINNRGLFNTDYSGALIGQVEANTVGNTAWTYQTGSKNLDICNVSSLRTGVANQTIQMTNGVSGVSSEMIFMDDTSSPITSIFSTSVPTAGRTVILPTGKDILTLGYYGRGSDEKFQITRTST